MIARQDGDVAILLLGSALLLLFLVGGLGLAESARATALRTGATRTLIAATAGAAQAAQHDLAAGQRVFEQLLQANLGEGTRYEASLRLLRQGERDPLTDGRLTHDALMTRLALPYRPAYLGFWLPGFQMELVHLEPLGD